VKKLKKKELGSIFGGLKTVFFRVGCFGFIVKGLYPLLLPLVSLLYTVAEYVASNIWIP
jgi:hypothetical protein